MNNKTTYPKARLAAIKKRGGTAIAIDLMTDTKTNSAQYETMPLTAHRVAVSQVIAMTTRQLYAFLKANGFTFDVAIAMWKAARYGS